MSDQHEQAVQSTQTPEELRQRMLEQLDTSKKAIEELSDDELEAVGGAGLSSLIAKGITKFEQKGGWKVLGGAALSATTVQTTDQLKQNKQG